VCYTDSGDLSEMAKRVLQVGIIGSWLARIG
jgi:hypothetical protein